MSQPNIDETTFDDVAMILLFFFLVLIFFVFAKKWHDVELREKELPKPVEKTRQIKTHKDTDGLLYVDADQGIRLRNLGGLDDPRYKIDIDAKPSPDGEWFSTEQEETSDELLLALTEYYMAALDHAGRAGGRQKIVKFYVASDPAGKYGVLHQITRALNKLKKAVKSQGMTLIVDVRPCPAFPNGVSMADELFKYNQCCVRLCGSDAECLKNFANMEQCSAETGVKRNDIIKTFCRWPKLETEEE